jgi:hypothetical protein
MKQVHIGGFTGCGGESLRDAVKVSRTKKPPYKLVRAATNLGFGAWLDTREPGDLVVCGFDAPSVAVAAALERGYPYEEALQTWLDEAGQALSLAEAEPGVMILVNISAVLADPESLARLLAARTGIGVLPAQGAPGRPVGLVHRPLAERLLAGRVEVDEIVEELSATALVDGAFEPTREQLDAALEAARRDAETREQAARDQAALVRVLANALAAPAEALRSLSCMGIPDDADAARARENLEGLIALLQAGDEPDAHGAARADAAVDMIAEILALAAEDMRRAQAETEALQEALALCSEEARVWPSAPASPASPQTMPQPSPDPSPETTSGLEFASIEAAPPSTPSPEIAHAPDSNPESHKAGSPALRETAPSPSLVTLVRDYLVVRRSRLFDPIWYRKRYSDLDGIRDPALHFVLHGAREGRAASAYFSAHQYRAEYPDVARSGKNPLVHYVLSGRKEGRRIFPVVDAFANQE